MRSSRAKVLHELLGRPLVAYPVELARELGADARRRRARAPARRRRGRAARRASARARSPSSSRAEQRGTGPRRAPGACRRCAACAGDLVLVLYGDVPLLRRETLSALVGDGAPLPVPGAADRDARPIRPATGASCATRAATSSASSSRRTPRPRSAPITEVNAGIYAAPAEFLRKAMAGLVAAATPRASTT